MATNQLALFGDQCVPLLIRLSAALCSRGLGVHRRRDHDLDDPVADLRHLSLGSATPPASGGRAVSDRGHRVVCDPGGAAVPLNYDDRSAPRRPAILADASAFPAELAVEPTTVRPVR